MSTEPSREHVEAVLKSLYDSCPECRGCGMVLDYEASMRSQQPEPMQCERCAYLSAGLNPRAGEDVKAVEYVLTSTDPAVLDAMQDALVRAGRLRVESDHGWRVPRTPDRWGMTERHVDEVVRAEAAHPHPVSVEKLTRRRHVTEWQEDQP